MRPPQLLFCALALISILPGALQTEPTKPLTLNETLEQIIKNNQSQEAASLEQLFSLKKAPPFNLILKHIALALIRPTYQGMLDQAQELIGFLFQMIRKKSALTRVDIELFERWVDAMKSETHLKMIPLSIREKYLCILDLCTDLAAAIHNYQIEIQLEMTRLKQETSEVDEEPEDPAPEPPIELQSSADTGGSPPCLVQ